MKKITSRMKQALLDLYELPKSQKRVFDAKHRPGTLQGLITRGFVSETELIQVVYDLTPLGLKKARKLCLKQWSEGDYQCLPDALFTPELLNLCFFEILSFVLLKSDSIPLPKKSEYVKSLRISVCENQKFSPGDLACFRFLGKSSCVSAIESYWRDSYFKDRNILRKCLISMFSDENFFIPRLAYLHKAYCTLGGRLFYYTREEYESLFSPIGEERVFINV